MAFNQPFLPQNFENFSYPRDIATSNFDSFLWKGAQNDLVKLQCFTWVWYCGFARASSKSRGADAQIIRNTFTTVSTTIRAY